MTIYLAVPLQERVGLFGALGLFEIEGNDGAR
jgi:hypothetical protein